MNELDRLVKKMLNQLKVLSKQHGIKQKPSQIIGTAKPNKQKRPTAATVDAPIFLSTRV